MLGRFAIFRALIVVLLSGAIAMSAINCASAPPVDHSGEWSDAVPSTDSPAGGGTTKPSTQTLIIAGGTIELLTPAVLPVKTQDFRQWIERAAIAISDFYGRYPVRHVVITVSAARSGRLGGGVENDGDQIHISLGRRTQTADLLADWELTHEMFHLSQPSLPHQYSWMSEGMADYLEPVSRVRLGQITVEKFWKDLVEGLPQGLPEQGDQGLDHTDSWGRTYWGGCMFWMLADVRVRQQTHNQRSVRDAAKAVLDAGGDGSQDWSIDRLLDAYDRGTGTAVFKTLHDELGNKPTAPDLNSLWKSLGVIYSNGNVSFDSRAPLANIRVAMTTR